MPVFQNAFLTGASSGIGRAVAIELAKRGTRVVVTARRRALLDELVSEIEAFGGEAQARELDVRDAAAVQAAIGEAEAERALDLVIANAGVGAVERGDRLAWKSIDNVIAVNVTGAMATLMAALPAMRERDRGTLVGVSSIAGIRALPNSSAYSASKAALSTFLESLQIDLSGSGLRVVDVQPGFVRTPMTDVNDFAMPFLLEVEDAARRTVDGIERGKSVVSYPWQLSWPMRTVGRLLPRPLWRMVGRMVRPKADRKPTRT